MKGALVDPVTGEFLRPGVSIRIPSSGDYREGLIDALQRILSSYDDWTGPVGCSITKAVARALGVESPSFDYLDREVGSILRTVLPDCRRVVTVIHTEAAGYAHLALGPAAAAPDSAGAAPAPASSPLPNKLTLVCTIGAALGAVLYNDGHRVRNIGLNTTITSGYEADLAELQARFPGAWTSKPGNAAFVPPVPQSESGEGNAVRVADVRAWAAWMHLVDDYLLRLVDVARPDEVVLMPTGGAAKDPLVIERLLPALCTGRFGECLPEVKAGARPEGAIVKGAAIAAAVEARTLAGLDAVRAAVRTSSGSATAAKPAAEPGAEGEPRALSAEELVKGAVSAKGSVAQAGEAPATPPPDVVQLDSLKDLRRLRAAFDTWDDDGDGFVTRKQLRSGLKALGINSPPKALLALGGTEGDDADVISFDAFAAFWDSEVANAPVTLITSEEEFNAIVGWWDAEHSNGVRFEKPESGDAVTTYDDVGGGANSPFQSRHPITVLKIGMTFCRPCKSFERKYERYATAYNGTADAETVDMNDGDFVANADPNVFRFVRINGNENSSTVHLCRDVLKVSRTPTFCLFHNGVEIHRHTGIDVDKFEAMLRQGEEAVMKEEEEI